MPDNDLPEIHLDKGEYDKYYRPQHTSNDITKRLDMTMGKFRDLVDRGFIEPSEKSTGQGKRALFNRIDIYALLLFLALVKKGLSRKLASKLSQKFRGIDSPLKICDRVAFITAIREGQEITDTFYFSTSDGTQPNLAPLAGLLYQPGFKDMIMVNLFDIRMEVDRALADV
jgi:hypothetical protein